MDLDAKTGCGSVGREGLQRRHRNHGAIRLLLFAFVLLLGTVLLLTGLNYIAWPRRSVFRIVILCVGAFNLAWWVRADARLAAGGGRPAVVRWGRLALAAYAGLALLPLLGMIRGSLDWHALPLPAVMWTQLWYMLLMILVPIGAILGGAGWLLRPVRRAVSGESNDPPNPGRRAFLQRAAVTAPIAATGAATVGALWQLGRFEVCRYEVGVPGLPERLRGLTLTHLSDLHVGRLFGVEDLCRAVDVANRLDSDIVVVTGDVVDHSNEVLPETTAALLGLRHRYGLFLCLGNHDLIDDGAAYVEYVRDRGLTLLINERRELEIGGETVAIGGLQWTRRDVGTAQHPGHEECVAAVFHEARAAVFSIALAHHPHAFDPLARRGVGLTLAGHTHGGQLMLTPPGWPEWGAGRLLFRYVRGFYAGDGSAPARPLPVARRVAPAGPLLFVNRGLGNWFPVRVNAGAEMVQIRLI